jgi:hypothetical protein
MLAEDTRWTPRASAATQRETILSFRGWFGSEKISVIARLYGA